MRIKIKENAKGHIRHLAGQWVEVDTTYLFQDQFNTVPLEAGHNGYRVMEADVLVVEDDLRIGMGRCQYCGKNSELPHNDAKALTCPHCLERGYMTDLTPRKVSYADQYPNHKFLVKVGASCYYLVKDGLGSAGCSKGHPNHLFSIHERRGGHTVGYESIDSAVINGAHPRIISTCARLLQSFEKELEQERAIHA